MQWTPQAQAAAQRARLQTSDDAIEQAIHYAEQLAEEVASSVVDTDLWRQAFAAVTRAKHSKSGSAPRR